MTPQDAAIKHPTIFKIAEDGILEMYADNHTLSSYRKCPGYFVESMLNRTGTSGRSWSLEFGQYFHKVMEYFYKSQKEEWKGTWEIRFPLNTEAFSNPLQTFENFLSITRECWLEYKLDELSETPGFKKLGGYIGALNLFTQYYNTHFQQERLRVVGTELSFGRSKEVYVGTYFEKPINKESLQIRFFYCGCIDLVVDDGSIIGPMDHKTTSYFDGTEGSGFKPHDGMQGYVYAFQKMLPEALKAQGRTCNSIYINHISLQTKNTNPTGSDRFKHSIISYTPAEMDEWRNRQVRTFTDIYRSVILEEPVNWDTERCNSWFGFNECAYKQLHAAAPLSRDIIRKSNYIQIEAWSHDRA